MLCGGGYLGDKTGYGGVGGVGGVYSSNYGCYYTNMDYLSPSMGHSPINVPPVSQNFLSFSCFLILPGGLEFVCRIILISVQSRDSRVFYQGVNHAGDVFIREAGEIPRPNTLELAEIMTQ